jgi:hypothetical protein
MSGRDEGGELPKTSSFGRVFWPLVLLMPFLMAALTVAAFLVEVVFEGKDR